MSRGYGLRKLTGGLAKREREAWARLDAGWTCALRGCAEPGVAIIPTTLGDPRPVCAGHYDRALSLGYRPWIRPSLEAAATTKRESGQP